MKTRIEFLGRGTSNHLVHRRSRLWAIAAACGLWLGCTPSPPSGETSDTEQARRDPKLAREEPAEPPHGDGALRWPDGIDWERWDAGRRRAAREGKPLMLLVYADWCPKCASLVRALDDPELVRLSRQLVMVRQDHDARPDWLANLDARHGAYVPRVLFFDSKGATLDIDSGHPEYPHFYAAQFLGRLKASMQAAIAHQGPRKAPAG